MTAEAEHFSYAEAFERNIGWFTESEQLILRSKRVAIAGLGGVGGAHLLTLARIGIGAFTLADFDEFSVVNFNRQVGANVGTIGRAKIDVMAEMVQSINPEVDLRLFPRGVACDTISGFLQGADLFVDGLDFFAIDIRQRVFERAAAMGIPAVTAAPIGMGVGFLAFLPGKMSFEQYFRLNGQTESEQYLRFLMGLAPRGLHRDYLVDPTRVDLAHHRGPSTAAACQLCAGVTAAVAVKLLLHRGGVRGAPFHLQFDAYRGRSVTTNLRFGNDGPIQRLRLAVARRMFSRLPGPTAAPPLTSTPIETVLRHGRWAPSGDNAQPWRFSFLDAHRAIIDFKAGDHGDIYDFRDHEPTTLSTGMLIETLSIAARHLGWTLCWNLGDRSEIQVRLKPAVPVPLDPLYPFISVRSVNRRAYRRRALRPHEMVALAAALEPGLIVTWHASSRMRRDIARLGAAATAIRLRTPEAYEVHRRVLDWSARDSPTGIPADAVGVDRMTLRLMRWTLRRWGRVRFVNSVLGTGAIAAQLDWWPGWCSAAYFTIRSVDPAPPGEGRTATLLRAGQAMQRFWLTATRLGLAMQPAYATLIFAQYGADRTEFTTDPALLRRAQELAKGFEATLNLVPGDVLFLGRIGEPVPGRDRGRSVRRSLEQLTTRYTVTPPDGAPEPAKASHPP